MTGISSGSRVVPFFNYQGAFLAQRDAFLETIGDVIRRGAYIQQKDLADFEAHLASYLGVRHAIGVGNATDGLLMLCRAAGLGPGDEVIFPSHTMVASAAAVALVGATPVPVDIGEDHLIDPGAIEPAITPKTRAILPVQLNGRTCAMDTIIAIASRHHLVIIEDAAQALGSRYKGQFAGTFGIGGAFSFYPAKILGCLGDGGAVVTNDDEIARKVRLYRDHGRNPVSGEVELWGMNSRLDNLQAALLDYQFRDYQNTIERRRSLAALYQEGLGGVLGIGLPPGPSASSDHFDVFQNYEIEADRRDDLRSYLSDRGVGTIMQWGGKAVHQFPALGLTQSLPRTERFFRRCLMLPLNLTLEDEDVRYVCAMIRAFYRC